MELRESVDTIDMKLMGERFMKRKKAKTDKGEFHPSPRLTGRAYQPILKKYTADGKPLVILPPPKGNRAA